MTKILAIAGMTIGGLLGWELGALVSTFTGFIVCVIGTGIGLYLARRFNRQYLP